MNNIQGQKINVTILTGFLGAGKTTVLNCLLEKYQGQLNLVIENEFGKVSVDGTLVKLNTEQVFELNNGCICCSLSEDLYAVLNEITFGPNPPDNVFIEASGMADPGAIASVFMLENVQEYFVLRGVLGVADAVLFEDSLKEVPEAGRQLAIADVILLNKSDLVTSNYLNSLQQSFKKLNPHAQVFPTSFGILNDEVLEALNNEQLRLNAPLDYGTAHQHSEVKSITLDLTGEEYDLNRLKGVFAIALLVHYHQIYRIKGLVNIKGKSDKYLVQSVGKQWNIVPLQGIDKVNSNLVVIGKDITEKGIRRLFSKALMS